jgi:hypothetical protein
MRGIAAVDRMTAPVIKSDRELPRKSAGMAACHDRDAVAEIEQLM